MELSTEEKIKEAAVQVFVRKGFAATKTRDIAEEAGINIASLHYYYRSKDKLFELVIGEALRAFSAGMDSIFSTDDPLHVKVWNFVDRNIDFIQANPFLPTFILSEAQRSPDKLDKMLHDQKNFEHLRIQLDELAGQGEIRQTDFRHFVMNMMGLVAMPFLAKPLLIHKFELDSGQYDALMQERKQIIYDMVVGWLYFKKPG